MKELIHININLAEETGTGRLEPMTVCTKPELERRFLDCVKQFNAWDNTIGGYLDQFVTMHSVHKNIFANGILEVEAYFADQFDDNPHFEPGNVVPNPSPANPGYKAEVVGNRGRVWGYGLWRDAHNTNNKDEMVKFNFKFACISGAWLLTSGLAQPPIHSTTEAP